MKKHFHLFQLALFALVFGVDRFTKMHVAWFKELNHFGFLSFAEHANPGFILQSFSSESALPRIVFVCSLYGFLFFAFFLLQGFLPAKLKFFRMGLTVFFAAISGNCFDRAFHGAVTDFVGVGMARTAEHMVYFNFADVGMWVGVACIFWSLFDSGAEIWHPNSKRKGFIVDFRYQMRSAFQTSVVAFSATLILILFSYTFFSYTAGGSGAHDSHRASEYLLSASALGLFFSTVTFFTTMVFSHRSAGPLFAFEGYVEALLRGDRRTFSLRKGDEHQRLVALAEKLKIKFESIPQNKGSDKVIERKLRRG